MVAFLKHLNGIAARTWTALLLVILSAVADGLYTSGWSETGMLVAAGLLTLAAVAHLELVRSGS